MRHDLLREYSKNSRDFDSWLRANVVLSSIVAIVLLTMALGGIYSDGGSNEIELSSIHRLSSGSH